MPELTSDFELHAQLAADTLPVISLELNDVLLMNDERYVWCILVPRIEGLRELFELSSELRLQMHDEIDKVSVALSTFTGAYKMNIAALGNMVEQLHVHVIARHKEDAAWPGPVWGVGVAQPYSTIEAETLVTSLRQQFR